MIGEIWAAIKEMFIGVLKEPSIIWYLAPIIVLWFILEIYFGVYKKEKLGWNTSLGNGITLMWICIESLRYLFFNKPAPFWGRFAVLVLILFYAVGIIYLSFSHRLSSRVTYLLASPTPIFFLSAVTALWGHGIIQINKWTIAALLVMFGVLIALSTILKKVLPGKEEISFEEMPILPEEKAGEEALKG